MPCWGHYPPPTQQLLCLTPRSDSSLGTTRKGRLFLCFFSWPLCQHTKQALRDLAHATASTQLQNNYSAMSEEVSAGQCSSPCCSVHRNRISIAKSDGCCSPKPWLRASSEPASRLRQDPAEQGALSSPAHLQQTQASWKIFYVRGINNQNYVTDRLEAIL